MKITSVDMNMVIPVSAGLSKFQPEDISIGGFTMTFGGKEIFFDFDSYDISININEGIIDADFWDHGNTLNEFFSDFTLEDFAMLDKVSEVFISDMEDKPQFKVAEWLEGYYIYSITFAITVEDEDGKERIVRIIYYYDDRGDGFMDDCIALD